MDLNLFYLLFLIASVVLLGAAVTVSIVLHRVDLSKGNFDRRMGFVLTPFQIFVIGFFIATVVLFYPINYTGFVADDYGFVKVLKSILLSMLDALKLFLLNGEFFSVSGLSSTLGAVFTIYAAVIYLVAPALSAGVVLSFFKGASAFIRYCFYPRADIYILSELNERSIILAQDIVNNRADKRRALVVFTDVFEKDEESNFELISQAKRLGAICMRKDIVEVGLRLTKNVYRKIYLIGDDEDENLKQALTLIERCKNNPRYNNAQTQIFVFANSAESEVLLNSIDNGEVKVRRVNENRNLIIHTLNNCSIFKDACEVNGVKQISIAVVGLGSYGIELLKAACWCGQMPGYSVTVHAFDKHPNCEDIIKNIAPELIEYNNKRIKGEPYYNIVFHDGVDVQSYKFQEELSQIDLITSAFVTLGDDELNIETAMKMRIQLAREENTSKKHAPTIYAVVYSMSKNMAVSHGGLKNMCNEDYGISFIGSIQSRYSIESIEQLRLEEVGKECHMHWVSKEQNEKGIKERAEAEAKYNKYEYYRRSSIAEAIYINFREMLVTETNAEVLKEYEHKRWNAYMRSEGYVGGDKKDYIAKTHPSLIPYQKLSPEEKAKDGIKTKKD